MGSLLGKLSSHTLPLGVHPSIRWTDGVDGVTIRLDRARPQVHRRSVLRLTRRRLRRTRHHLGTDMAQGKPTLIAVSRATTPCAPRCLTVWLTDCQSLEWVQSHLTLGLSL